MFKASINCIKWNAPFQKQKEFPNEFQAEDWMHENLRGFYDSGHREGNVSIYTRNGKEVGRVIEE